MPQTIEQGDIFGRIGRSFGEGLSEQIPKEMDRQRLSSGVKDIINNKDLSEAERYAKLLSLPGGAEHAGNLIPAIQRSQQTKNFLEGSGKRAEVSPKIEPSKVPASVSKPEQVSSALLATPQQRKESLSKIIQPSDTETRDELARKLINEGQALDRDTARSLADQQISRDKATQEESRKKLRERISGDVALTLEHGPLGNFQDIRGRIQKALLDEADHRLLSGGNAETVGNEIGEIATRLGEVATQTRATGALSGLTRSSNEKIDDIKEQKKPFADLGFGREFDDLATASLGISPLQYASEIYPTDNDKFKELVKKNKSGVWSGDFLGNPKPLPESVVNRMVETIRPEDNILSMAAFLRENGEDISDFIEKARAKKGLSDDQKADLKKSSSNTLLGDLLFRAFKGKKK